jgi:hypothetical protein
MNCWQVRSFRLSNLRILYNYIDLFSMLTIRQRELYTLTKYRQQIACHVL